MKKRLLAVLLAGAMVLSVTACGASEQKADAPAEKEDTTAEAEKAPAEEAEAEEEAAGEVVELRLMDVQGADERTEYFEWAIEKFHEENPDIHVTFESVPWDSSYNKLVNLGAAGDMPDIFVNNAKWFQEFDDAGWIYHLDEYWEGYKDQIVDTGVEYIQKNQIDIYGSVLGFPHSANPESFLIRTDWLEEVGMTVEDLTTWDGIYEAVEKMTDPSKNRYGMSYRGGQGGLTQLYYAIMAATGGINFEEDGRSVFYRDEVKAAVQDHLNMYLNGYAPTDSINWAFVETVQAFSSGLTGVLFNNADVMGTFGDLDESSWASLKFPEGKDGKIYATVGGYGGFSISGQTEHPDEAWEFLTFLNNDEILKEYCLKFYALPATKSLSSDPQFAEGKMAGFVETLNADNTVDIHWIGYFPEATEFERVIFDAEMQACLLGQQTVDEMCDKLGDWLTEKQKAYMDSNPNGIVPNSVVE